VHENRAPPIDSGPRRIAGNNPVRLHARSRAFSITFVLSIFYFGFNNRKKPSKLGFLNPK
jgi:hypothetical protein